MKRLTDKPMGQHSNIDMPVDCHKCQYYFVTWNPSFPHGCRAMGFKSRRYPTDEVRSIMTGKDCALYSKKQNPRSKSQKTDGD